MANMRSGGTVGMDPNDIRVATTMDPGGGILGLGDTGTPALDALFLRKHGRCAFRYRALIRQSLWPTSLRFPRHSRSARRERRGAGNARRQRKPSRCGWEPVCAAYCLKYQTSAAAKPE